MIGMARVTGPSAGIGSKLGSKRSLASRIFRGSSCVGLALALMTLPSAVSASPWSISGQPAAASGAAEPEGDEEVSEAEYEWAEASNAYALGNYSEAVAHFERSYELSQEPEMLFNIGQAYARWYELSDDVAHLRKARKLFENYRLYLEGSEEENEEALGEAKLKIAELDAQIAAHDSGRGDGKRSDKPVYKRGWFWGTIVGVLAVAAGVTMAIVLTRPKDEDFDPELGTLGEPRMQGLGFRF
jgi:tetratricopeptide (TPR) repeat protein